MDDAARTKRKRVPRVGPSKSMKRRAQILFHSARHRAIRAGAEFSLRREWVVEKLLAGNCERTGLPFVWEGHGLARPPFAPSIDKIDPAVGYTEDNCVMVVWIYNVAKGGCTHDDVVLMAKGLLRQATPSDIKKIKSDDATPPIGAGRSARHGFDWASIIT